LGGEVVVADPFQRYRGLEIAADSPRAAQLAEIRHHGVGDLALTEGSTAAGFARMAHEAIDSALGAGRVPVVAGGTGLYLRAALADMTFPDEPEPELREWSERPVERE
jgi:tRNA dimethylallyltransferase